MNNYLKVCCMPLIVTFLLALPITQAALAKSSMILGSTYDIDSGEVAACSDVAGQIASYSSSAGYDAFNWYGAQTTASNVYTAASGNGQSYSISYFVGHGGYVYEWHWVGPLPFYEQQFVICEDNGGYVYDKDIFQHTLCQNSKFVLLWSCDQGDTLGGNHLSGVPFGMPYAWFHTNSLSSDGFSNPDSGAYCFIGWNGDPCWLSDTLTVPQACRYFLIYFYNAALLDGSYTSVKAALNFAAQMVWGVSFVSCILYTGLPGGGYMEVFGNGNMHISSAGGGGGGGCPYVSTWNGVNYALDNSILGASEDGNGTDTKDYYKLEQQLVPTVTSKRTSLYSLRISEFENEQDYIDQVKLMAVDHSKGTNIAVTPEGEILTYKNPTSPMSCVDNNGADRLSEIATMNGNVNDSTTYFQGYEGNWLLLNFGKVTASNANLIFRDDQKCMDVCINVQVPDSDGAWQTVDVLHPRSFWGMEAVNMTAYIPSNGNFTVRLLWTAPHRLDYVGLDTSRQASIKVTSTTPAYATHSTLGDVKQSLLYNDENTVELVNGEEVTMGFILPNNVVNTTRDFIFFTDGYYYTIG